MIFWSAYLFLFVLGALLLHGKLLYLLVYTFLIIHIGVKRFVHQGLSNLQVQRNVEETHVFQGESTQIKVVFRNPTALPVPWLMVKDRLDINLGAGFKQHVVSLMPFGTCIWTYEVTGRTRGMYPLGPMTLASGDPFGLYQQPGVAGKRDFVVVYPRIRALSELGLPSRLPFGDTRTNWRIFEDPSRTIGVRDYHPGDGLKRIHWKVSARKRQLQVKQYQPTMELNTIIFLNLRQVEYDVHAFTPLRERAIETSASVAFHLEKSGIPLGFVCNGWIPPEVYEYELLDRAVVLNEAGDVFEGTSGLTMDMGGGSGSAGRDENREKSRTKQAKGNHTPDITVLPRTGAQNLIKMLEIMAVVNFNDTEIPFTEFVRRHSHRFSWGTTLIIITPGDTGELIDLSFSLLQRGFNVVILVTGFRVIHRNLAAGQGGRGLRIFHINLQPGTGILQVEA